MSKAETHIKILNVSDAEAIIKPMVMVIHLLEALFDSSFLTFKICQKRVPGNFKMNSSNICISKLHSLKTYFFFIRD